MSSLRQSRLRAVMLAAIVAAGAWLHAQADVVAGAENWTIETGTIPHIVYDRNRGVNFAVDKYGSNGWEVVVHHARGWGYVEVGTVGAAVSSAMFLSDLCRVEGTGDVFRFAFHWWPPQDSGTTVHHYGWVTLGTKNGELVIIAAEVANASGVAVIGRGEPGLPIVPSGPDDIEVISEKPDNIILQWDFNSIHDRDSIYTVPGMDKHFILGGDIHGETRTNFNGRSCVRLSIYKQCMAGWFSINETGYWVQRYEAGYESWIEYVGEYHKPALYDTIGVALRLWADVPCTTTQAPHTEFPVNGIDWFRELHEYSETLPDMPEPPGAVIHVDDKMWLRYVASEDGGICKTNWQACVGMMDASSNIVERTVDLKAADDGATLPSPVGAWTTVRIEAENAASPNGLGFRIWIGGVAAASTDDATVFYARPTAADRSGVAALAVGGNAYIDDLTFFKKHRNPLDGVDINTWHGDLSESEADTLAAILGEESLPGLQFIDAQDWDSPSDDFAAMNCIRLGITPAESDLKYTGEILTLKFKNPTVAITAVDFAAGTITGKVIPADGTRVAAPPMPYMFGLTEVPNIGAGRMETNEYGDRFSLGEEGFSVDLTDYVKSNGVFTLHFPEWVAPSGKSLFFKVQIKEYSHK